MATENPSAVQHGSRRVKPSSPLGTCFGGTDAARSVHIATSRHAWGECQSHAGVAPDLFVSRKPGSGAATGDPDACGGRRDRGGGGPRKPLRHGRLQRWRGQPRLGVRIRRDELADGPAPAAAGRPSFRVGSLRPGLPCRRAQQRSRQRPRVSAGWGPLDRAGGAAFRPRRPRADRGAGKALRDRRQHEPGQRRAGRGLRPRHQRVDSAALAARSAQPRHGFCCGR